MLPTPSGRCIWARSGNAKHIAPQTTAIASFRFILFPLGPRSLPLYIDPIKLRAYRWPGDIGGLWGNAQNPVAPSQLFGLVVIKTTVRSSSENFLAKTPIPPEGLVSFYSEAAR